jgi:hypothetical protein
MLRIIKKVEDNGVEAILMEAVWYCLKDCKQINSSINSQLIITTQFDEDILEDQKVVEFKTVFLVGGADYYNDHIYPKLLDLYNIDKFMVNLYENLCFHSIIIKENQLIENRVNFS